MTRMWSKPRPQGQGHNPHGQGQGRHFCGLRPRPRPRPNITGHEITDQAFLHSMVHLLIRFSWIFYYKCSFRQGSPRYIWEINWDRSPDLRSCSALVTSATEVGFIMPGVCLSVY